MIAQQPCNRLNNKPQEPTSWSSDPGNMLRYMTKGIFQMWLNGRFWVEEVILAQQCNHKYLYNRRQKRRWGDDKVEIGVMCFENGGRTTSQGTWKLEKGREMDFSLGTCRRSQPCWHLDFSQVKLNWGFWPPQQQENKRIVLRH